MDIISEGDYTWDKVDWVDEQVKVPAYQEYPINIELELMPNDENFYSEAITKIKANNT